ncbi:MAG: hypothetical protein IKZ90_06420 [Clostridiales bacterium]|nr:hypothetical protein [Clostridiales bacterium]
MRYKTNNLWKRIIAAVLLLATLAGTTTLLGKKVEAACSHSNYSTITVISQASCTRTGTAYCKCNSCGQTFYKTLPATGHRLYVKDVNGYTQLRCAICETRFQSETTPKGLDDFAGYLYGKKFNQLSGSWKKGQKQNAAINWISYTIGCSKERAKDLSKDYTGDLQIRVDNADKLITFVGYCNNLASKYGFSEAGTVANILGKASFVTCMLNPSKSTGDKVLAAVSKINPYAGSILSSYKTICKALIDICIYGAWDVKATDFEITCDKFGITFEAPTSRGGSPKKTPTYKELFTVGSDGKTKLDKFVNDLLAKQQYTGFSYLCANKSTYTIDYAYVILWLVRPALEKEFSGSTEYKTILSLLKAAK